MKTRVIIFTLIMILIVQGVYAAAAPSRTIADLYTVELTKTDGTPGPNGQANIPETESALAVLEDTTSAILYALDLRELISLLIPGYTEDLGDLIGKFTFPTKFDAGKPLVFRVGFNEGEQINWVTLKNPVNEDGNVIVTLPQALLTQMQAGNAVIAVYYHTGAYAANFSVETALSLQ